MTGPRPRFSSPPSPGSFLQSFSALSRPLLSPGAEAWPTRLGKACPRGQLSPRQAAVRGPRPEPRPGAQEAAHTLCAKLTDSGRPERSSSTRAAAIGLQHRSALWWQQLPFRAFRCLGRKPALRNVPGKHPREEPWG